MFSHAFACGSRPKRESASGSPVRARISAEWIQKPTNASTFARGFSRRSCQKSLPDWDCWSIDDLVGDAPPELQRHAGARDRAGVGDRAARRIGGGARARAAADLAARDLAEGRAELGAEQRPARVLAADAIEVPILERQIGHGRERRRAGQQVRMASQQQQRLLAAHAAAERVDLAAVDPEPRQRRAQDLGHAREVGDLAGIAPGVAGHAPAARVRVDHREGAAAGQVAPQDRVRLPVQAAPVRRDHERQRRVGRRPVPRREHHGRRARVPVVRDVVDLHPPDRGHARRRGRPAAAVADDHLEPAGVAAEVDRLAVRQLAAARRSPSPTRRAGRAAAGRGASASSEPAERVRRRSR